VRVFTSIEFLQGSAKVYESKPVVANEVTAPDRKAVIFQIDLPLQALSQDSTCARSTLWMMLPGISLFRARRFWSKSLRSRVRRRLLPANNSPSG